MKGRLLIDRPGSIWKVVETNAGPNKNLYKLRIEGGTQEALVSGYEILHYYYPFKPVKEK